MNPSGLTGKQTNRKIISGLRRVLFEGSHSGAVALFWELPALPCASVESFKALLHVQAVKHPNILSCYRSHLIGRYTVR